ncbi:unnamed protein product [Trifolium pratense]|uniref:Uncharacterized protein n=1 Tax=Trifolium pratense TaxID=57577 RepID=A0ACB0IT57_TRIPR|nr:unnamed protein product [Trifolium pratense]
MIAVGICGSDVHYLKVDIVTVTSDFNIRQKNINPISISNIICILLFPALIHVLSSKQFQCLLDYLYYFKTMRCADFIVKEPMVIGHECAGIIEEVGSQIQTLVPGDRVAIEPGISCWPCDHCKLGRYNLCPEMKFFATPPVHGSLANQIVHPADLCFKLPENVSLEEGAMCEPLSVGVHACRRANIGPETNVLIMESGPMGLVTMLSARTFGAPRIVVVDMDDHRLSVAKSLGTDDIVKVSTSIQVQDRSLSSLFISVGLGQ